MDAAAENKPIARKVVHKSYPKPSFSHDKLLYTLSAILTVPLLIDICTACRLFSLWIAWSLFTLIGAISLIRLIFAFKQHCYRFAWGLIGQLALGGIVLGFFQLSITNVIETPVSHPVDPAVVNIAPPVFVVHDSIKPAPGKEASPEKENVTPNH